MSVSIEDKIELFRNIIIKEIEEEVSEKELKAKEGFKQEKDRLLAAVTDKKGQLLEEAVKRAEKEKQQILAKANSQVYHKMLDMKQQFIKELLELLRQEAGSFTAQEGYKEYISRSLDKAGEAFEDSEAVKLYFTGRDLESLGEFINQRLSAGKLGGKCLLQEAGQNILGGFYAEDGEEEMQVDYTLKALIEDNHELIGRYISRRFDEVQGNG